MSKKLVQISLLLMYSWFAYLLFKITLQYLPYNTDVAFLRIKQDYIQLEYYRIAFFVHVYTSVLLLPAAFTQFLPVFKRKWKAIHKFGGWLYVGIILLFAGPSGLIIGIYANGGWSSRIAFVLLAVLWMVFTIVAMVKLKAKKIDAHKAFMIRSFALTLSAITLRLWKYIIVAFFHPRPMDVYQIVAWLGWGLNLFIAELIILKTKSK